MFFQWDSGQETFLATLDTEYHYLQEGRDDTGSVWECIISHEKECITQTISHWQDDGPENIFKIVLSVHVALDDVLLVYLICGYSSPDHLGSTSPTINSNCKLGVVSLSHASQHT